MEENIAKIPYENVPSTITKRLNKHKIQNHEINQKSNQEINIQISDTTPKKHSSLKKWIIIAIIAVLGAIIVLVVVTQIVKKKKNLPKNSIEEQEQSFEINPPDTITNDIKKNKNRKEALKIFEPSFNVISKIKIFTQILMKSREKQISISLGAKTSFSYFTKAIFDIYTLNESLPIEKEKEFYKKKYFSVITMNSQCRELSYSKNDCELEKYIDLNEKNRRNLQDKEATEEEIELLKQAVLPICVIEHTETNLILSITCPETLSSNLKDDIILAFRSIKPDSFKGNQDNETNRLSIEEKDDKIFVNTFTSLCENYEVDPFKNQSCEITRNIITDKEGNLISINKTSISKMIKDEKNNNYNYKNYYFESISNQNSNSYNPTNFESNLETLLELIKPFLKKENFFSDNSFEQILEDLINVESRITKNSNILRILQEEDSIDNIGIQEGNILTKPIYNINFSYSIKNDLGLGYAENSKVSSIYTSGNQTKELSIDQTDTKLNETINQFISLSKAGNILATLLLEKIKDPLLEIGDDIDINIKYLNNLLAFSYLSNIFDSTLSIDNLDKLPYTFVSCSQNLYANFNQIYNDLSYSISEPKAKLKESISSFLSKSHELIFNIFKNLTESTNLLSSEKSKIAEVMSYYLNDTDTSYNDLIQKAKEKLSNYYIKEKEIILPLINNILLKFKNESLDVIANELSSLDNVVEKLDDGSLTINLANNEDIKKVIENIYNSKIKVKDIVSDIVEKLNQSIGIQNNGYFITKKELEDNQNSYSKIGEDATLISEALDKNTLIDKTFDEIMIYFREQFIEILNYMDKSKRERFPIKENILSNSTFSPSKLETIDSWFDESKSNILNFINNENRDYKKKVDEKFDSFFNNNDKLEKIISNIQVYLSKLNLDNLNTKYNELLTLTLNSVDQIIENIKNRGINYLNNVKNVGPIYRTKAFTTKYNIYKDKLTEINNYINLHLKNNLVNKYKNVITDIRSILQSIKSNNIFNKYYLRLPFFENHKKILEEMFLRLDKYISDDLFNKNYLSKINNYISSTIKTLNSIEKDMNNIYKEVNKLGYCDSNYDYYEKKKIWYDYCCFYILWWCVATCDDYYYEYKGHYTIDTDNHVNLPSINFNQYTSDFDKLFSNIYNPLKTDINSYNNYLNELSSLESIKKEFLSKNVEYLNTIDKEIDNYLKDDLGLNIINESYKYFKNELSQKLPIELNDFLNKWVQLFDKVDEDLQLNIDKFLSQIGEFEIIGSFYYQLLSQNITYDYVESLVEQRKNDMNYTIKYYYNIFLSKVNKTYSYILNNMPINNKPFDEIINVRTNEIKTKFNNIINKIELSRKEMLSREKQLSTLKVSETNFFLVNSITNDNVNDIDDILPDKYSKIGETIGDIDIDDKPELVIARFYLENAQNGKQIKKIFEPINKATFLDLQTNSFQDLINEIYKIDQDELIKNIFISINEFNDNLTTSFKYEKDNYIEILQNKITKELFSKEDLEKTINNIYKEGLNDLDTQSANKISGYINEVLINIKNHLTSEASRINNELSSYSTNYNVIKQNLNNYKNVIYNQFYSAIISLTKDFRNQVNDKFYMNYIDKNLIDYYNETIKQKFKENKFLNSTINLTEIIIENIKILINDYKNVASTQIEYLYNKTLQNLDILFSFSNLKSKISNDIDNYYNSILLPILKKKAIYNPGDEGVSDYNFSSSISENIISILNQKINQTNQIIINKMKGKDYIIKENWKIPDFTTAQNEEFKTIKNSFNKFCDAHDKPEKTKFRDILFNYINKNFMIFIDSFVPTFGKDFFDRILRYNEIQKIKSLYGNLKYSLIETILYYLGICYIHDSEVFPVDLKYKILSLNNLEEKVNFNNNNTISSLNSKIDNFFEETKNYIVEKYIQQMKIDPNINMNFDENIKQYIVEVLDGKRYVYEKEYIDAMNSYIKLPFLNQYTNTLNQEKNNMLIFIEKGREDIRSEINEIFSVEAHDILLDIENKLNNTLNAINDYDSHLKTFSIPNNVQNFLNNYMFNEIKIKYADIKSILDKSTKDLIINGLESNSEDFKNVYSIEDFEIKSNEINTNLTDKFNEIINCLKSYGTIEEKY